VTVSDVTVVNGTTITARFTLASDAAPTARNVTVTTTGGTSGPAPFTVNRPLPTLASIAPASGGRGEAVAVTFTGTSFVPGGTSVAVSGTGITVSGVNVASATSLTATFTVDLAADLGDRAVMVTTSGGTSGPQTFTVLPAQPVLSAIAPASGELGETVRATLSGANFVVGATTVQVSGAGVTATNVGVASSTSLIVDLVIASDAALGARSVTVTANGRTSDAQSFTVLPRTTPPPPPPPTLTRIQPNAASQQGSLTVTFTGTNFVMGGTTVSVSGAGVAVSGVTVVSGTIMTAVFVIAADAVPGVRNVLVTTASGTSGPQPFTVLGLPAITSFAALATHLTLVQPTRLVWATTNATTCSITGIGPVACSGSMSVVPGVTTTYRLTASSSGPPVSATSTVFVNEAGRFVYSTAQGDNQLRMNSLNPATGDLTPIGGGTIGAANAPVAMNVDPSGRYAYATGSASDRVLMYTIDPTTGALTANGTVSTGGLPLGLAIDPTGRFGYVVNQNAASVSAYTVNASGQLVTNGVPVVVGGVPSSIAVDALGRFAYVANSGFAGGLIMHQINANGTLTALGTQPTGVANGAIDVVADPTGRFVYATTGASGTVLSYVINANGTLSAAGTPAVGSGQTNALAADPLGRFVYALDYANSLVHALRINQVTGALTLVGSIGTGLSPLDVACDPQGKFLYVTNFAGSTISIYSIDSSTGALTPVNSVSAGTNPSGITVSR
jgi:6-phosphogluconolactonase (cycloisomerase 2 family)